MLNKYAKYAKNAKNVVFQAASQFNLLEMIGPNKTPEHGITNYHRDNSQGPRVALASPAGTFFRNYLIFKGDPQTSGKQINTLEIGMYPGNHEYPYNYIIRFLSILQNNCGNLPNKIYTNVALSYCSVYYPDLVIKLHKEIKTQKVLYIGNYLYSDIFLKKLFGENIIRINTNSNNAFDQYENVFVELENITNNILKKNDYYIIIIAAGCASRAFASIIYDKFFIKNENFFLFDYGSLLDYFYGLNTRAYMDLMPPNKDYILNNL